MARAPTHVIKEIKRADPDTIIKSDKRGHVWTERRQEIPSGLEYRNEKPKEPIITSSEPPKPVITRKPVIAGQYDIIEPKTGRVIGQGGPSSQIAEKPTIRAASSELQKATALAKVKEVGGGILGGLWRGFTGQTPETGEYGEMAATREARSTSYLAGGVIGIAGFGKAGSYLDDIGRISAPAVNTAKKLLSTKAGKFVKLTGLSAITGQAAISIGERTPRLTATEAEKAAMARPDFKAVVGSAHEKAQQEAYNKAWYKGAASEVSLFFEDKKAFESAAREEFKNRGLEGQELNAAVNAALRQRKHIAVAEAGANLGVSAFSERTGRFLVTESLEAAGKKGLVIPVKSSFGPLFKKIFPGIAAAGAQEGAISTITQREARGQPFSTKETLIGAGFGSITAGVIGGTIGALVPTRPGTSKAIELGTYIMDPFEKPGDILADVSEGFEKNILRRSIKVPTITKVMSSSDLMSIGTTTQTKQTKGKRKAPKVKGPTFSPVLIPGVVPTPIDFGKPIIPIGTPAPTPTPTDTGIPTQVDIPLPTDTGVPTPVNTPINQFVNNRTDIGVNVNVPTPVTVPIPIPTGTPLYRIPPPIPLQLPAFDTGGTGSKKKNKKYLNELFYGRKLINNIMRL